NGKLNNKSSSYIKITVEDSGPGIAPELSEKIFERYYQLTDAEGGRYNWGTGIGLYYARALAMLHHGALFMRPRPDNAPSSTFVLLIPASDEAYGTDEHITPAPKIAKATTPEAADSTEFEEMAETGDEKPLLLAVEDDIEVIHYLKTLLSPAYRMLAAYNGETALQIAAEQHPNLIISDVMMPGMDGYELCRRIKNDVQLCHIPVILVTAQSGIDSQIQGLNTGADAYVTKPFDTKYLFALIRSLLSNRDKLKNLLNQNTEVNKIESDLLSGPDKVFMDELYTLMEKELSNADLDIMQIAEMMHISRTKVYYKVKELTGQSPATFFKTYKLNRAVELIREGHYNVSEIAYMTGFSTHAHFTTSFKKQFGVPPSVYAQE
ncbi:MAG: response regulator, partial [Bacteroidales bacterium]|nr:response regulator [Bacteroidales bacterium]